MKFAVPLLAAAAFAMLTNEFNIIGVIPLIAHDLNVPVSQVGLLVSAFGSRCRDRARGGAPRRTAAAVHERIGGDGHWRSYGCPCAQLRLSCRWASALRIGAASVLEHGYIDCGENCGAGQSGERDSDSVFRRRRGKCGGLANNDDPGGRVWMANGIRCRRRDLRMHSVADLVFLSPDHY